MRTVPDKPSFPDEEVKVLKYWDDINAFHKQLELSEGKKEYTFYDGPPFATGLPHYGHIAAGTIKVSTLNLSFVIPPLMWAPGSFSACLQLSIRKKASILKC